MTEFFPSPFSRPLLTFAEDTQTLENVAQKISPRFHVKFHNTFGREKRRKTSLPHFCRVAALTKYHTKGCSRSSVDRCLRIPFTVMPKHFCNPQTLQYLLGLFGWSLQQMFMGAFPSAALMAVHLNRPTGRREREHWFLQHLSHFPATNFGRQ